MSIVITPHPGIAEAPPAPRVRDRGRDSARNKALGLGAGFTVLVLLAAEALIRAGLLPAASFPPPSMVAVALFGQLGEPGYWLAIWDTLSTSLLGVALIIVLATPVSLLIGFSRRFRESTWFLVEFLKPIPPVALIPLGLILWGPSPTMKLFLVVFGALWPLLTQLVYGTREVGGVALDMARSYRLGRLKIFTHVVLPSILPFAATGLRVATSIAIVISVVAEMVGGAAGLGQNITVAQSANAIPEMYALILTTGLLGLGINGLFKAAEKSLLFWHASQRKETP